MKVTLKGQVTVPKKLRERFGITSKTEVEFLESNGQIILVKKGALSPFSRFRGIARPEAAPQSTDEFLRAVREEEA